jgi:tRNA (guanine37-N1)-methyltransferase
VAHELGSVPDVLLSGDHARIARWRRMQALGRTAERRPDLLAGRELSRADRALMKAYAAEPDPPGPADGAGSP